MPLRLLHVSDIHFLGYGSDWDYDADQRRELLRDVRVQVVADGHIDGILVGGDIAFRAAEAEYEAARRWLDDLRAACGGIDIGRVWTVPGNHDIDRSAVESSEVLTQFRLAVRQCAAEDLDAILKKRLVQDPAADGLVAPLAQYNVFAGKYQCSVTCKQPHWYDASLKFDGLTVGLLGLNSVLISDRNDSVDEDSGKLVLGTWQCIPPRDDDTVHIAIAHHPPGWIRDWGIVEPYLRRAHLLLFGHEHTYAARQSVPRGTIEIHAGAVGPERDNARMPRGRYAPSYNIVTLARESQDTVNVTVHPRCWNHDRTAFVAHPDGVSHFDVAVEQPPNGASLGPATAAGSGTPDPTPAELPPRPANPLAASGPAESAPTPPNQQPAVELRRIGSEFMRRTWTDRVDIARTLGVLEDHDLQLPDTELFPLLLRRIRDTRMTDRLIEELNRD